jgi:ubiquinol oxidase
LRIETFGLGSDYFEKFTARCSFYLFDTIHAGVPGMLAAGFRHFYSLRTLKRDHGSIFTFLEEAENERMHLLVCLKMFKAQPVTKGLVIAAQLSVTPALMITYMIHPPAMHRFVGYLEETAVETYSNIVEHCETPGTKLHEAWAHLPAPAIAKSYWSLKEDASWVTCLKHMLADEAHHRDVNHTFASLPEGVDNPFIAEHMQNFDKAALRRTESILKMAMQKERVSSNMT